MPGVEGSEREDFDDREAGVGVDGLRAPAFGLRRGMSLLIFGGMIFIVALPFIMPGLGGGPVWRGPDALTFGASFDRLWRVCKIEGLVFLIRRLSGCRC
jgi:hypothetical protein